jgi:hypothetical protein
MRRVKKMCNQVTWCLFLFLLTYGVTSSAIKHFVNETVGRVREIIENEPKFSISNYYNK